ncbi:hypothetical protein ACWIGM_18585 [Bosea sp. NPDC055332]
MPASPTTDAYASSDHVASRSLYVLGEPEALALQLLVEKRARQRDLQRDVAVKAAKMLAELGSQARAADLDLLGTFLELAAVEAERERCRWGEMTDR